MGRDCATAISWSILKANCRDFDTSVAITFSAMLHGGLLARAPPKVGLVVDQHAEALKDE